MLDCDIGNGIMNAPRYWQVRDDAYSDVRTSANTLERMGKLGSAFEKADASAAYPYGAINFSSLGIRSESPTAVRGGAESLKGSLSHMGLLNEPNFGRIYLAGKYL